MKQLSSELRHGFSVLLASRGLKIGTFVLIKVKLTYLLYGGEHEQNIANKREMAGLG